MPLFTGLVRSIPGNGGFYHSDLSIEGRRGPNMPLHPAPLLRTLGLGFPPRFTSGRSRLLRVGDLSMSTTTVAGNT